MRILMTGHGDFPDDYRRAVLARLDCETAIDTLAMREDVMRFRERAQAYLDASDEDVTVFSDILIGSATQYFLYLTQSRRFRLFAGLPAELTAELIRQGLPDGAAAQAQIAQTQQAMRACAHATD